MKIGIFLGELAAESGGGFTFQDTLVEVVQRTAVASHDFVFLSYGSMPERFHDSEIPFIRLRKRKTDQSIFGKLKSLLSGFSQPYTLEHAVLDQKIDMVWFAIQDFEQCGCPYVYTIWDLQHRAQPWFPEVNRLPHDYRSRESHKEAIRRASAVIAPNETSALEISQFYGVPLNRILRIHHPTPDFVFTIEADASLVPKTNKNILLYPAQFWPHKNHVCLLEAVKILATRYNQDFEIVFTGANKGNEWHVQETVNRLAIRNQCHFLGFVTSPQLMGLYKNSFALVFPTFFGPENLPPLEAMACRLPCIVSDVPGAREQFSDAALYFDPKNEDELALRILELIQDPAKKPDLLNAGEALAKQRIATVYLGQMIDYFDEFAKIRRTWS